MNETTESTSELAMGQAKVIGKLVAAIEASTDMKRCLAELTRLLVDWSGCSAVGIRLQRGDDFPYVETVGFPEAHLREEDRLCEYGPDGSVVRDEAGAPLLSCMCGNVIRGRFDPSLPFFTPGGSFWSSCTTKLLATTTDEQRQARTRNRCNGEGYESVALIPLRFGAKTFGLVQFNDLRTDRFTRALISEMEDMAGSLAQALSRREAELALQASEAKYRILFEASPIGLAIEDFSEVKRLIGELIPEGAGDPAPWMDAHPEAAAAIVSAIKIVAVNEMTIAILGAESAAEVRLGWPRVSGLEELAERSRICAALVSGARRARTEIPVVNLKSERLILELHFHVLPSSEDDLSEVVVSCLDVTARRKAEEDAQRRGELLENIMVTTEDAIVAKDEGLRILTCSRAYARLLGKRRDEMRGTTDAENGWIESDAKSDGEALDGSTVHQYDRTIAIDGEPRHFDVIKTPLRDDSGRIIGLLSVGRDIGVLVAKEKELRRQKLLLEGLSAELRSLNAHIEREREDERRAIALDIHDDLGQRLTAVSLGLHALTQILDGGGPEPRARIDEMIVLVRETIGEVQRIAARLRPKILDDLGLRSAIDWLAADLRKLGGPTVRVEGEVDESRMSDESRTAAFRISKEALTNVARHSAAKSAEIRLSVSGDCLSMEIRDEGVGMGDGVAEDPCSFGIAGMRERAISLGGRFSVASRAGAGTLLSVEIPLMPAKGACDD